MTDEKPKDMIDEYGRKMAAYHEFQKQFKPGQGYGGIIIKYYPLPDEMIKEIKERKEKNAMEEYEKSEAEKKKALLELRREEPRTNGHSDPDKNIREEIRETAIKEEFKTVNKKGKKKK